MMPSSRKGKKRKSADSVVVLKPPSKPSKVTFLSPSLVLLEIPADTNTSLPVWEAMRSQLVDIAWTVNPYSISVNLTPLTAKQGKITTSTQTESTSTLVPPSTTGQAQMMIQALSPQQVIHNDKCNMHHTPYPFHWQLWSPVTHNWIDISHRSQVSLESLYCEVNCEDIFIKDGAGFQSDPAEPVSDPPRADLSVDPLKEFSSWYPPVWRLASKQDFSLVKLPAGTAAYRSVQHFFHESLPETEVDIISIQQVENLLHWDKYQRQKAHMQKHQEVSTEPLERHLFHGTNKEASKEICRTNFDPRIAGRNGASRGLGSYFSISACYSNTFSAIARPNGIHHMFLAKVLVGNVTQGKPNYRRPPPIKSKTRPIGHYDTCVDDVKNPTMFVVFDSCQCYPYYLIKYKELTDEIEM